MRKYGYALSGVLAIALILSCSPAQASYTFANAEQTPAHGLVVVLSAAAEVNTDAGTGAAGPGSKIVERLVHAGRDELPA